MNTWWQDLRVAARSFLRNPGFTVTAILSLALGIGANTAMFTVADAVLLHRLPYRDADRLVILWNRSPGLNITEDWFSTAQYFDIRAGHPGFEQLAIAIGGNQNWTGAKEPERVATIRVSSNLLPMLGARVGAGRLFTAREDSPGAPGTAILSYATWARRFGMSRQAIGQTIILNGQQFEIVGVLARGFLLPREVLPTLGSDEDPEILLPLPLGPQAAEVRTREDYNIIGKLKPGVSAREAQAGMDTITARLRRDFPALYPPNGGLTFGVVPLLEQVVGGVRGTLRILMGAVGFVLLIACANIANLLLSRAVVREKEIAVRMAVGAGPARIARQLLTESGLLAAIAGAVGVALSVLAIEGLRLAGGRWIPRLGEIAVNWVVVAFTLALSLVCGVVFGMAPVLQTRRFDVQEGLKRSGRGSGGGDAARGRGFGLRHTLVVFELALSIVLSIGAGLLLHSFIRLQSVSPGFDPNGVLTFGLTMSGRRYDGAQPVLQAYKQIRDGLEAQPGVTAAGAIRALPLSRLYAWGPITVEGRIRAPGENFLNADVRVAAGNYFQAMGIPLRRGRWFAESDTATAPRVAIVDEFMAGQLWPNEDAIGKRFHSGDANSRAPWITVVGVAGRVKQYALEIDSRIAYYLPHTQNPSREMTVVVRSARDAAAMGAAVRKVVAAVDPDLPIYQARTMTDRVRESMAQRMFSMALASVFAGLALMLAAIGTYGVMSYLVTQGFREMGIRLAIGATPRAILLLVLRRGCALSAMGIGAGLAGSVAAARLLRSQVFGIEVVDPVSFIGGAAVLAGVAMLASYLPARRASRIDPMASLREG